MLNSITVQQLTIKQKRGQGELFNIEGVLSIYNPTVQNSFGTIKLYFWVKNVIRSLSFGDTIDLISHKEYSETYDGETLTVLFLSQQFSLTAKYLFFLLT